MGHIMGFENPFLAVFVLASQLGIGTLGVYTVTLYAKEIRRTARVLDRMEWECRHRNHPDAFTLDEINSWEESEGGSFI
eukprot:g3362.t1